MPWEQSDRTLTPAQVRRALPHSFSWPAAHWVLTSLGVIVVGYLVVAYVLEIVRAV